MNLSIDRSNWTQVKFGDVVTNVNDNVKDPSNNGVERSLGLDHLDPGEIKITRWGSTSDGGTFTRRVKPGQTLFGKRRAYQRKTAYAEFDAVCSGDILVFASKDPSVLLPELLPFLASTDAFYEHALQTSAGSLSPRTRWTDLSKYEFLLPPSEEQRRIAGLLWSVERHLQAMSAQRESSWSVLMAAVDDLSRLEYPIKKIQETLSVARGGSPRPINDYLTNDGSGVNWIKIGDISPDGKYIDRTSDKIRKEGTSKSRQVRPGDLLLSNSMSFGRPYIVRIDGYIHDGWLMLTDKGGNWRSEYLYFLLRSEAVQTQFNSQAGGSTVKNLNKDRVAVVEVPVPPIQVQDRELERLNTIEQSVASIDAEITSCIELRRLLMLDIFEQRAGDPS